MKKILLIVVSAALSFACGNSERERIDKADIKAMSERQRAMAEKTGAQNMDVKYNSKSVSSATGGYAREENANKDVLVAGDNGIFWNGNRLTEPRVTNPGSEIAISLNERGDWIAVGDRGIYVKIKGESEAREIRGLRVGNKESHFAAHINENGDWIVAGNQAVVINGIKVVSNQLPRNATRFDVSIDDNNFWNVHTNVGDAEGIFNADVSESSDDGSSQQ